MNDPLNDWDELQSEWQSYQPDMQKIKKKINWVTWRMVGILAFDILAVLFYFPFLYFVLTPDDNSWAYKSFFYLMGVLLIYGTYLDFKIRLPIIFYQGESTKDILNLYLDRIQAGILVGKIGKYFGIGLLIINWIWIAIVLHFEPEHPKVSGDYFVLFFSGWMGGISLICWWYERKKQKEYIKLKALWQDYMEKE